MRNWASTPIEAADICRIRTFPVSRRRGKLMTPMEGRDTERGERPASLSSGQDRMIRVLIAEDGRLFREALVELIRGRPYLELVGVAEDAARAIELACRHKPDVAVLDVGMPGGGGPEAARGIRSCSPATGIMALSVYEDRESIAQMAQAGAREYVLKGTTSPAQIIAAIQRVSSGPAG